MNRINRMDTCADGKCVCRFNCSLARTAEDRDEVYRLRHDSYRRDESIDALPDGRFSDHYDELPNSFSFLVRSCGALAKATVRLTVVRPDLGWNEAPSWSTFGDHPALEALARESYVEANRLCFGPLARRDAFIKLLGHMAALADVFDTGWLVACPRVEHTHAYRSMFGFRELAEPRQYYGVRFQTQLLGIRREELRENPRLRQCMTDSWKDAYERVRDLGQTATGLAAARNWRRAA